MAYIKIEKGKNMKYQHSKIQIPTNKPDGIVLLTLKGGPDLPRKAIVSSIRSNYIKFLKNPKKNVILYDDEYITTLKVDDHVYFFGPVYDDNYARVPEELNDIHTYSDDEIKTFVKTLTIDGIDVDSMLWSEWYEALDDWKDFNISHLKDRIGNKSTGNIFVDTILYLANVRRLNIGFAELDPVIKTNSAKYLIENAANLYLKTFDEAYKSINQINNDPIQYIADLIANNTKILGKMSESD